MENIYVKEVIEKNIQFHSLNFNREKISFFFMYLRNIFIKLCKILIYDLEFVQKSHKNFLAYVIDIRTVAKYN